MIEEQLKGQASAQAEISRQRYNKTDSIWAVVVVR